MQMQYTKQAANVIRYAAAEAKKMRHPYIGTEHLLLGLRREYTGVAGQILAQHGVEEEKLLKLSTRRTDGLLAEGTALTREGITVKALGGGKVKISR